MECQFQASEKCNRGISDTKSCKICEESDPDKLRKIRNSGGKKGAVYLANICNSCTSKRSAKWAAENPEKIQKNFQTRYAKLRELRKSNDPKIIAKFIYEDCKAFDRKKGFTFALTKECILELILKGCSYCGDTTLRPTLDRIDNSLGHTEENVVPACIRCNFTRRDMPYKAWLNFAPTMRKNRIEGLFGDWTGSTKKKTK